jgi:hypothetical protein
MTSKPSPLQHLKVTLNKGFHKPGRTSIAYRDSHCLFGVAVAYETPALTEKPPDVFLDGKNFTCIIDFDYLGRITLIELAGVPDRVPGLEPPEPAEPADVRFQPPNQSSRKLYSPEFKLIGDDSNLQLRVVLDSRPSKPLQIADHLLLGVVAESSTLGWLHITGSEVE